MEEQAAESSPAPNKLTYNTVLKAMAAGDDAERAETLLSHMEELARHDKSLAPDSYSHTSVITNRGRQQSLSQFCNV